MNPLHTDQILSNPHVLMGFEVEFVFVGTPESSESQAFDQAQAELELLGLSFNSSFELVQDKTIEIDHHAQSEYGMELVSPPLSLKQSLGHLQQVFDWMIKSGHKTNQSTGLHINISVEGLNLQNLDKLKLLLLLGEHRVQQLFHRLMNTYTESHVELLKKLIAQSELRQKSWTKFREFEHLKQVLNSKIDLKKYRTVNFSKIPQGYLEFRIIGNQDYHLKWSLVKQTTISYAFVLLAALDPHAFVDKYEQELARMFALGLSQARPQYPDLSHKYASMGSGSTPLEHMQVLDYINRAKKALQDQNPKAAIKLITMSVQKAAKHAHQQFNPKLTHASALSYKILIQKLLAMNIAEFALAQAAAGVKPDVIQNTQDYLKII